MKIIATIELELGTNTDNTSMTEPELIQAVEDSENWGECKVLRACQQASAPDFDRYREALEQIKYGHEAGRMREIACAALDLLQMERKND